MGCLEVRSHCGVVILTIHNWRPEMEYTVPPEPRWLPFSLVLIPGKYFFTARFPEGRHEDVHDAFTIEAGKIAPLTFLCEPSG
jgi:hypothetical protein